ncbi:YlqD family protein [Alteribacillus iranensis]|uniref:YlqD protein n=1 Tax=Alteribacillus iranensis TaxID=930128 RepID=A0A1I2A646_9BACI|nr:YlqD family protein [Alteribacillus iranensis]SFE39535.1 YlqD protein [Alteribacillus iranensis]
MINEKGIDLWLGTGADMRIIKKVPVKYILTEKMKSEMKEEFDQEVKRLTREIEQLRFQMHKQIKSTDTSHQKSAVKQRFTKEIEKRNEQMNEVTFQRSQLFQLPLGAEITTRHVDSIEEVDVGSKWPPEEKEIIVKDGEIVTIRNRTDDNNGMV